MSDALVKTLNSYGYQPVFLPHTGYLPPDMYSFANHKLIRHGSLQTYIKDPVTFQPTIGKLGSIEGKVTSGKNAGAAVGFLSKALSVLGVGSLPKLDLSFAGSQDFVFAFTDVTFEAVDPNILEGILQELKIPLAIPDEVVTEGDLHIAYEYAYATTVKMSRADGRNFAADVSGNIGSYVDLGVNGKVAVSGNSTVTFSSTANDPAAFAYKAGRLEKKPDGRWIFQPEIVKNLAGSPERKWEFVPAFGVVLLAEERLVAVAA